MIVADKPLSSSLPQNVLSLEEIERGLQNPPRTPPQLDYLQGPHPRPSNGPRAMTVEQLESEMIVGGGCRIVPPSMPVGLSHSLPVQRTHGSSPQQNGVPPPIGTPPRMSILQHVSQCHYSAIIIYYMCEVDLNE